MIECRWLKKTRHIVGRFILIQLWQTATISAVPDGETRVSSWGFGPGVELASGCILYSVLKCRQGQCLSAASSDVCPPLHWRGSSFRMIDATQNKFRKMRASFEAKLGESCKTSAQRDSCLVPAYLNLAMLQRNALCSESLQTNYTLP